MDSPRAPTHHAWPLDGLLRSLWRLSCSLFARDTLRGSKLPGCTIPDEKLPELPLSPIDMVMPRMHVPKLLYFPCTAEPAAVTLNLRAALGPTLKSIPIIAGSVAPSKREGDQKGALSVQGPYFEPEDILSSNDLRKEYDYEQLRAAHFPSDAIPFDAIAPRLYGKTGDSAPVMVAQANFVHGGLLLFLAIHHCVLDEVGLFNVMKVWSSCCRGDVSLDFVTPLWFDRSPLLQGTGTGRLENHPEYTLAPEGVVARAAEDPNVYYTSSEDVHSAVFFFSDEALGLLKTAATTPGLEDRDDSTTWISTNDALTALLWCCVTSARAAHSTTAKSEIFPLFAMAVNGRSTLRPPMPPDYCGNVVLIAKTLSKADDLLSHQPECLAKAASLIRKAVNVVDDTYVRDVIQMVRKVDDLARLAPRRRPAVNFSLGCSTWARQPYYSLDWGSTVGGTCERVRWRNLKTDGLFLMFPRLPGTEDPNGEPRARQGGVEVQLGLQRDHLHTLMEDPLFTKFAQWRCS